MNSDSNYQLLWDRWCSNAEKNPAKDAVVHWAAGEEPFRWSFENLVNTAEKIAVNLKANGIKPGDVCAVIIRHNKYFYPIYMAVSCLGAVPAVLAYPNPRLHPDKFRQGIEGMSQRSGLDWILTEKSLEPMIKPLVEKSGSTIKGLRFPLEWNFDFAVSPADMEMLAGARAAFTYNDPVLLQHSSGTTGLQKPVVLSHRAVLDHVKYYGDAVNLNPDDKIVSWLPLYHDMGLIAAFHLPLAYGITTVHIDTFEWVVAPSLLPEVISKEKGTLSWLPNFALNMMADKIYEDELEGISLDSWRLIVNCSEPVRADSHTKFINRFAPYGLKPSALSSAYAMAETTFAVTQSIPGEEVKKVNADRNELANGRVVLTENESSSRVCVSSGRLVEGCSIRILNEAGEELPSGMVGEIVIKSVSMFDGYRNYPEKTAEALKEGWYYSGDYGFEYEGSYYIIGRKKDIIIVAGNNIYPEDVEDTVSKVQGVIPGRVVAFGEFDDALGSEQVSVVAETNYLTEKEQKGLKLLIMRTASQVDISIKKVYLVPSRWLIKSSAGKPGRKANRERILNNPSFEDELKKEFEQKILNNTAI
jgi:acyl-CoA synthetase (AMP-forming)/AMP-acid ligase II